VSTDPSKIKDITEGDSMIVDFTYSVKWKETTIPFEKRMEKYSRYSFLPQHLEARRKLCPIALASDPNVDRVPEPCSHGIKALGECSTIMQTLEAFCRGRPLLTAYLMLCTVPADPLVQHHQLLCDGAAADGLPGDHPHARAQERLHQVLARRRGRFVPRPAGTSPTHKGQ